MKPADVFYQATIGRAKPRWDVEQTLSGEMAWDAWRGGLLGALRECLGAWPGDVDLEIQRGEAVPCGGYTREKLSFLSEEDLRTPAYLLIPEGAKQDSPVAVALHGHGYGVRGAVGLSHDDRPIGDDEDYHKNFAVRLARRGFVVIAPELLGFGDLRLARDDGDNPGASSCDAISSMLLAVGRTMAGARVQQARRALDALRALGYGGKAVSMGISGGGLVCAYHAALDERIGALCVSGFANTYKSSILAMHHCIDNYQPRLLLEMEEPDILASIAPRPMIWEAGEDDPIFPKEAVQKAHGIVGRAYEKLGAKGLFALDSFPGGHQVHAVSSIDFLERHGKGQG